jgi:hypothetical protein
MGQISFAAAKDNFIFTTISRDFGSKINQLTS